MARGVTHDQAVTPMSVSGHSRLRRLGPVVGLFPQYPRAEVGELYDISFWFAHGVCQPTPPECQRVDVLTC
jgi:hypothetical protein